MTADRGPYLLDITRLAGRIGRGPLTGIDRVERAYLRHLPDAQFLVRTGYGYLILPASTRDQIDRWLDTPDALPHASLLDQLRGRKGQGRVEAGLRQLASHRGPHWQLNALAAKAMPTGGTYLNVGHSDLGTGALRRLKAVPNLSIQVMIHDTIPLDYPQYSRPQEPARFRAKLTSVARFADLVICPSEDARARVAHWCAQLGRVPPIRAVHLAVEPLPILPASPANRPYFVALGTIEPRKNHALLLDIWDRFHRDLPPADIPDLVIIGGRGWLNRDVFARLDAKPPHVKEIDGLNDAEVAAYLQGASALLMPSRAEGFGLPVAEALTLGVPVIAANLPVYREFAGDRPIYLDPDDLAGWAEAILTLKPDLQQKPMQFTTWQEHLNLVLNLP